MRGIKSILTMIVLGLCAPACLHAEGPLPVIKGIRVFTLGDSFGVEISADKDLEYHCTKMPQLLKVVIDLPRTEPGRPDIVYKYKSALISDVRLEKKTINGGLVSRVSINLLEDADLTVRNEPSDGTKVTVLLRKHAPGSPGGPSASLPGEAGAPAAGKPSASVAPTPKVGSSPAPANSLPIQVTEVSCGPEGIDIKSGRTIGEFKTFILRDPGRLIIDIPGGRTTLGPIVLPANKFGVTKTRFGLSEGKLRVVFEAGTNPLPDYEVVKTGTGLRVVVRTKEH